MGLGLGLVLLLAVACAPTAEPTATTAAAQPTATTVGAPTATTAVAPPTATTVPEAAKLRPIPVLDSPPPNPDATHGGVLIFSRSGWPADFSIWEAASGSIITP